MKRIAIIGNSASTLLRFRLEFIRNMIEQGNQVYAFSPSYKETERELLKSIGAHPVTYSMRRIGINPMHELKIISGFRKLFRNYEIEIVFNYFLKPSIYGSIAAYRAGISDVYSMFGGLGFVFSESRNIKQRLQQLFLKPFVSLLIKVALKRNRKVFFQNPDDLNEFVEMGLVSREQCVRIFGSGVNLSEFPLEKPVTDPLTFIMVGRLLEEKGYRDFYEAARKVKDTNPLVRFVILGGVDVNPGGISRHEVRTWVEDGTLEWPGKVKNVQHWLKKSSVFVLPSYREGTPRSGLEALAMGLPVITTDVPGCSETVWNGENGFLISPRSPDELARNMMRFVEQPKLIVEMGKASRKIAETYYDVHKVNHSILRAMNLLPNCSGLGKLDS
ncbi:MAG: glycosyltransferase family 4 protein [Balneolaceae bacterium]